MQHFSLIYYILLKNLFRVIFSNRAKHCNSLYKLISNFYCHTPITVTKKPCILHIDNTHRYDIWIHFTSNKLLEKIFSLQHFWLSCFISRTQDTQPIPPNPRNKNSIPILQAWIAHQQPLKRFSITVSTDSHCLGLRQTLTIFSLFEKYKECDFEFNIIV